MVELFTSVILFQFIVLSDFIYHRSALFSKLTEKMAQSVKQIKMLPGTFPKPNPCFFYCSFLPSISPLPLSVLPKYVSLYHMRHHGIGLSEAGNDFFALISALRRIRVVLVIRPFITLPARHSAVWVNAISPDSHNYPKIERGREISLENAIVGQREFRKIHRTRERHFSAFPTRSAVCMHTKVVCSDSVDVWCSFRNECQRNLSTSYFADCEIFSYGSIMNIIQLHYTLLNGASWRTHQSYFFHII